MPEAIDTKEKIIDAARKVFTRKGLAGARMKDIAEEAGINQALLHYHFKTKQILFDLIFEAQVVKMFSAIRNAVMSDKQPLEKLDELVAEEHQVMKAFPTLPLFVLYESTQNPQIIEDMVRDKPIPMLMQKFLGEMRQSMEAGEIRDMDERHLLVNTMSMILYPMIAKPVLQMLLGLDDAGYDAFIDERSTDVARFVRAALRPES